MKKENQIIMIPDFQRDKKKKKRKNSTNLRDSLGLIGLFCVVGCYTFSLDSLSLSIFLLIFSKKIDLIIFLISSGSSSSSFASLSDEMFACRARASKRMVLRSIWLDMRVPPRYMRVGRTTRRRRDRFENEYISLRRCIPGELKQESVFILRGTITKWKILILCNYRSQQKRVLINLPFDIRPGRKVLFKACKIYRHFQGDVWLIWMKKTRIKEKWFPKEVFIRAGFQTIWSSIHVHQAFCICVLFEIAIGNCNSSRFRSLSEHSFFFFFFCFLVGFSCFKRS